MEYIDQLNAYETHQVYFASQNTKRLLMLCTHETKYDVKIYPKKNAKSALNTIPI